MSPSPPDIARPERLALFGEVSVACSRLTTRSYSTSFSLSIRALGADIRDGIYSIYGFVRLADEVVDSFHGYDQRTLFARLKEETFLALDQRISTNPILQAFQQAYHQYGIDRSHVEQFLRSMEWDLDRNAYDRDGYDEYIVGSAEVVGLMCLKVFLRGDQAEYDRLEPSAVRLGAAFQKVNFLRDLKEDYENLGRTYFPNVDLDRFDDAVKAEIEQEIAEDLDAALEGIVQLPRDARFGVYLAYTYYRQLLRRISRVPSGKVMQTRVRVPDLQKMMLLASAYTRNRLNLV
ncbi:MAG: phytoene/squalene synthase family protein [Rhodothermales bacterium]|nr:phytoene/squalene synthase family protein [Rhodothermales bacterium]MBO6778598.1 phytoene/squalene synthase family protein [Rhodothermales bacterium]